MPISELVACLEGVDVPEEVLRVARGLPFRDFITVGVLVSQLDLRGSEPVRDNWLYIQDPQVRVGRIQIFNNWSPHMVEDQGTVWLGLEYFVNEGDELWSLQDQQLQHLAARELARLGLVQEKHVLDGTVVRVKKAYPAYFGTYPELSVVRDYLATIENLHLLGRNGMHRYNNQDHSMLTAFLTVENIRCGRLDRSNVWEVNQESDYHEQA